MKRIVETPSLTFSQAINQAAGNILQFRGRARRSEYWWPMALVCGLGIVLTPFVGFVLDLLAVPLTFRRLHDTGRSGWWCGIGVALSVSYVVSLLFWMVMAFLGMADMVVNNTVLEDSYVGGYALSYGALFFFKYLVWSLVILAYRIVLIVLLCQDGEQEDNKYGPSPKYVEEDI